MVLTPIRPSFLDAISGNHPPSQAHCDLNRQNLDQYDNPFFLHTSDHAGLQLVADRLTTGADFHSWRIMQICEDGVKCSQQIRVYRRYNP